MWKDDLEGLMLLHDGVLDGEHEALLRARIEDEPELAEQWRRLTALSQALEHELQVEPPPDFVQNLMEQVRQTPQVAPSLTSRLFEFLSRPIAVPAAAVVAAIALWSLGLPDAVTPSHVAAPATAAVGAPPESLVAGETEIESIDNPTDYNVLVLAAPGSPNRMIWISQRQISDEG